MNTSRNGVRSGVQWNLVVKNLQITISAVYRIIFFSSVKADKRTLIQRNLVIINSTKPRYKKHMLPVPWPSIFICLRSIVECSLPLIKAPSLFMLLKWRLVGFQTETELKSTQLQFLPRIFFSFFLFFCFGNGMSCAKPNLSCWLIFFPCPSIFE